MIEILDNVLNSGWNVPLDWMRMALISQQNTKPQLKPFLSRNLKLLRYYYLISPGFLLNKLKIPYFQLFDNLMAQLV